MIISFLTALRYISVNFRGLNLVFIIWAFLVFLIEKSADFQKGSGNTDDVDLTSFQNANYR